MSLRTICRLLIDTVNHWLDDNAMSMSAAVAFYTLFSFAPLLIVAIAIISLLFGEQKATAEVFSAVSSVVGDTAAKAIQEITLNAQKSQHGRFAVIFSIIVIVIGATGVFVELQGGMNRIWRVRPLDGHVLYFFFRKRVLGFIMVLAIAMLLMLSLVVNASLAWIRHFLAGQLPGGNSLWSAAAFMVWIVLATLLFATIYKILPDARIPWHDVWVGASVTSLLLAAGEFMLGLYLSRTGMTSPYGAAGSLVIILLWVYYSSMIFYFGAEFTAAYARQGKREIRPIRYAEFFQPSPV